MKLLIDANFFMIPEQYKLDIFEELKRLDGHTFFTLDVVVKELEKLAEGKGKTARSAKVAILLLKKRKVRIIPTENPDSADKELIKFAEKGYTICTQDKPLIGKLRKKKHKVVTMRGRRSLVLV